MQTIGDVIDALGGPTAVHRAIGRPLGTVSAWTTRNSVPVEAWPALLGLAQERNVRLTSDDLVRIHTTPADSGAAA